MYNIVMLTSKEINNMNIKKVKTDCGLFGIAYTKEATPVQYETRDNLKTDKAIHLFLGTSGIVPKYRGSKNNTHYYTFNNKQERAEFLSAL